MYLLYSILLVSWGILLLPALLYRAWRYHKYLPGLSQRFGRLPGSLRFKGQPTIWFHACSVGETLSLQPLVTALHARFPEAHFVFSTITKTGQLMAAQHFGEPNAFYFPVDFAFVCRRVLRWIQPAMIVIVDTEIWPNLMRQSALCGIPVVLANGRISGSSYRYYRWARPALRRVFRNYRLLMMQSEEDAQRIIAIGAPSENVLVTGNIKFEKSLPEKNTGRKSPTDLESFCRGSEGPLIVAGSTHEGEEQVLLEALQAVRRIPALDSTRLLIAPRHPERFDEVAAMVHRNGFKIQRRTASAAPAEVLLLDTLGELAEVYQFASIVFIGGTLNRHGGHSIMEPALYSKAIVVGPSMENFRQILAEFHEKQGVLQISAGQEERSLQVEQLRKIFSDLLQNAQKREAMGRAAFSILESNRGAARLTVERIAFIFDEVLKSGTSHTYTYF